MQNLDETDAKLLAVLAEDPRASHTELASHIKLSKNTAKYRLNRLIYSKILRKVLPIVNYQKLGLSPYDVYLKCEPDEWLRRSFESLISQHPNITWACSTFGEWNYYLEIVAGDNSQFTKTMDELVSSLGESFRDYRTDLYIERKKIKPLISEIHEAAHLHKHEQKPNNKPRKLSSVEQRLIRELCLDGRASYAKLARELHVTPMTARNNLLKLVADTTIEEFIPAIDYKKLGYSEYLLLLKTKYMSKQRAEELRKWLLDGRLVKLVLRYATTNAILLFVCVQRTEDLENFVASVKNEFQDAISRVDTMHIKEELKLDFFPEGLV